MDLEGIILCEISEISQKKTKTVPVKSKTYNRLLNITKKKQTHRSKGQIGGYQ